MCLIDHVGDASGASRPLGLGGGAPARPPAALPNVSPDAPRAHGRWPHLNAILQSRARLPGPGFLSPRAPLWGADAPRRWQTLRRAPAALLERQ